MDPSNKKAVEDLDADRKKLYKMPIGDLIKVLKAASDSYYNTGHSLLSDELFDFAKEILEGRDPKNAFLTEIGAPVIATNKVKLPFPMFSLDKVKPATGEIAKFSKTYPGPFVISDKLDGSSCMILYSKTDRADYDVSLFRRGNGVIGADISHLKQYLLPKTLHHRPGFAPKHDFVAIRGEVIMSRKNFDQCKGTFKDARGLVNGIMNRKIASADENTLKRTEFVAYEIVEPRFPKLYQMNILKEAGFRVVEWESTSRLNEEDLMKDYVDRRKSSPYAIDGLVIEDNGPHNLSDSGNPESAVAFKMRLTEQAAAVKVLAVFWETSKDGRLVPRIQYEPVDINGVILQFATGYNAKFIVDNGIGPGAVVTVIKSGDVIPKLESVEKRVQPSLPEVPYHWNETAVDIFIEHVEDDVDVHKRRLVKFFEDMGIENIGKGIVAKFYLKGFTDLSHYLNASSRDFQMLPGVQATLADKLVENIQSHIKKVPITRVMAASNMFSGGIGSKRLEQLFSHSPDIFLHPERYNRQSICEAIEGLEGIQRKTAEKVAEGIPKFHKFLRDHPQIIVVVPKKASKGSLPLKGNVICITGFRDKDLQALIEQLGGEVSSSVSKRTTVLITKDRDSTSGKVKQARDLAIKIMTKDQFDFHISQL